MKYKLLKNLALVALLFAVSCDEPQTLVTDIIHPDGSVLRRIEMRNKKNNFKPSAVQVPIDSTWTIKDSIAIGAKNDTTWFRTAEKSFKNVGEINREYQSEKGINRKLSRNAAFTKKFRWFNTIYSFSETIDKSLLYGYPPEKFLSKEELEFFRLPESESSARLSGPDSIKYKLLKDKTEKDSEKYFWTSGVSEWIGEFSQLTRGRAGEEISERRLKLLEGAIVDSIINDKIKNDSLVISRFLGEDNYRKFKTEHDTAMAIIERRLDRYLSFSEYSVSFRMPGKLTSSNGFLLKDGQLVWPVRGEFFLAQPYVMEAESRSTNIWAWIISALFLVFVLGGIIFKIKKAD